MSTTELKMRLYIHNRAHFSYWYEAFVHDGLVRDINFLNFLRSSLCPNICSTLKKAS